MTTQRSDDEFKYGSSADLGVQGAEALCCVVELLCIQRNWLAKGIVNLSVLSETHRRAARALHRFYIENIPAYRRVAATRGIAELADADEIWSSMMMSDNLFKSYKPSTTDQGVERLIRWIVDITATNLTGGRSRSGANWATAMYEAGIYISTSSGTRGKMSIVPRNALTIALAGMATADQFVAKCVDHDYDIKDYYALAIAPENSTAGLSQFAKFFDRNCRGILYLFGEVARPLNESRNWSVALKWMLARERAKDPVFIVGSPERVAELCELMEIANLHLSLNPASRLIMGGAWIALNGTDISHERLIRKIENHFSLQKRQVCESYGLIECNGIMHRCARGRYHVPPQMWPFVFDREMKQLPLPARGRFAFSDPLQLTFPGFILTSDLVTLTDEECPCGCQGPSILSSIQRLSDPRANAVAYGKSITPQ